MTDAEFVALARMIANEAEQEGFHNTARAMRQVLYDMLNTHPHCQVYVDADSGVVRAAMQQN